MTHCLIPHGQSGPAVSYWLPGMRNMRDMLSKLRKLPIAPIDMKNFKVIIDGDFEECKVR